MRRGWCKSHYYELRGGPACSVDGCTSAAIAKGLCDRHHKRLIHHGDPLRGGPFYGEPENFVENVVMPYEGDDCIIWPFATDASGYARVRNIQITRVICERHNGPAPSDLHQAAHSCGKGSSGCVTKSHLLWKTRAENEADKLIHGTDMRGNKHHAAKLTEDDVRYIRSQRGVQKQSELAALFSVSVPTISGIQTRNGGWSWLE